MWSFVLAQHVQQSEHCLLSQSERTEATLHTSANFNIATMTSVSRKSEDNEYECYERNNEQEDEEDQPLVLNQDGTSVTKSTVDRNAIVSMSGTVGCSVVVLITIAIILLAGGWFTYEKKVTSIDEAIDTSLTVKDIEKEDIGRQDDGLFTNNLDANDMKNKFVSAKQSLVDKWKIDYGDNNFNAMFVENNHLIGKKRFMMKLLQVQINQTKQSFIWATGGHSAAAGHGNFYDESMTSYLGQALNKVLFDSVGINFVARNYAMGGTSSAPEVAFCTKEIFGNDIDIIVWDFGMTDGAKFANMFLYFYRTIYLSKSESSLKPIGIAYHISGRPENGRRDAINRLNADYNMPLFYSDEGMLNTILNEKLPDTLGKTDDEIKTMPKFVQNFRCGNEIEKGLPYCDTSKFNDTMCVGRKFKTSWHPGW
jgi:hypothetical protein